MAVILVKKTGGSGIKTHHGSVLSKAACGRIYQDPLVSINSGESLLPSSIPVSSYCSHSYGNTSHVLEEAHLVRHLSIVDAVCRCRMGSISALFDYTGVYFIRSGATIDSVNYLNDINPKMDLLINAYSWKEARGNNVPRTFACREDYAVYLLLTFFMRYSPNIMDASDGTNLGGGLDGVGGRLSELHNFNLTLYGINYFPALHLRKHLSQDTILYDQKGYQLLYTALFPRGASTSRSRLMDIARKETSFLKTTTLPGFRLMSYVQANLNDDFCNNSIIFRCGINQGAAASEVSGMSGFGGQLVPVGFKSTSDPKPSKDAAPYAFCKSHSEPWYQPHVFKSTRGNANIDFNVEQAATQKARFEGRGRAACPTFSLDLPIRYIGNRNDDTTTRKNVHLNTSTEWTFEVSNFGSGQNIGPLGGVTYSQDSSQLTKTWKDIEFDPAASFIADTGYTSLDQVPTRGNQHLYGTEPDEFTQYTAHGIAIDLANYNQWKSFITVENYGVEATVEQVEIIFDKSASSPTLQTYRFFVKATFPNVKTIDYRTLWYELNIAFVLVSNSNIPPVENDILRVAKQLCSTENNNENNIVKGTTPAIRSCDSSAPLAVSNPSLYYWNVIVETLSLHFRVWASRSTSSSFTSYINEFYDDYAYLPSGDTVGDNCRVSELFGESRIVNSDGAIVNFSFYRGGIPTTGLIGLNAPSTGNYAGWDDECFSCFYDGEPVMEPSDCCSSSAISSMSTSTPFICNGTSSVCVGFPVSLRRTVKPIQPPSSNISPECDSIAWTSAVIDGTTPTLPYCPFFYPQPVKASFFTDVSKLGSFFDYIHPPSPMDPVATMFYGLTPQQTFDPTQSWLQGLPLYSFLPTSDVDIIYPFLSDDDPNSEVNRLYARVTDSPTRKSSPAPPDTSKSTQCRNGGCYTASPSPPPTPSPSTPSLSRALINLFPLTRPDLFTDHLWSNVAPSRSNFETTSSSKCSHDDDSLCVTLPSMGFDASLATSNTSTFSSSECCNACNQTASQGCTYWSYVSSTSICHLYDTELDTFVQNGLPVHPSADPLDVIGVVTFNLGGMRDMKPATECASHSTVLSEANALSLYLPGIALQPSCITIGYGECYLFYGSTTVVPSPPPPATTGTSATMNRVNLNGKIDLIETGLRSDTGHSIAITLGVLGPPPLEETSNLFPPTHLDDGSVATNNIYNLLQSMFGDRTLYHAMTSGTLACDDSTPYCQYCKSSYLPTPFQPLWSWSSLCSESASATATLFDRRKTAATFSTSLEQSMDLSTSNVYTRVFSTSSSTSNLEWWRPTPLPSAVAVDSDYTYCYTSSRGIVADVFESLGGVAVSLDGICFWQRIDLLSSTRTTHTVRLGVSNLTSLGGHRVHFDPTTSVIDWETPQSTPSAFILDCYIDITESNLRVTRTCIFPASSMSHHPPMLASLSLFQRAVPTSAPTIGHVNLTRLELLYELCGCPATSNVPTSPVCRTIGSSGDVECSTCSDFPNLSINEFVCGSVVDIPILSNTSPSTQRLCSGCPPGQVGQCGKISGRELTGCMSYGPLNTCDSPGYAFCHSELGLPTYLPGIFARAALDGVALTTTLEDLWTSQAYPMMSNDLGFWWQTSESTRSMWQVGSPERMFAVDSELCVATPHEEHLETVLEAPTLLHPTDSILEIVNLTAWCAEAHNSPSLCTYRDDSGALPDRARMCTYDLSTNRCLLRADSSSRLPSPSCFVWVPDIDPISDCGGSRFTGCVVSSTFGESSAILSTQPSPHGTLLNFPPLSFSATTGTNPSPGASISLYTVNNLVVRLSDPTLQGSSVVMPPNCTLGYWTVDPNDENTVKVKWLSLHNAVATRDTNSNRFVITLASDVKVLSLPVLGGSIFSDLEPQAVEVGLRLSIVNLPRHMLFAGVESPTLITTQNAVPDSYALSRLMTTCVPLTVKKRLDTDTMSSLIADDHIYRRFPVDCAMLLSNIDLFQDPSVNVLFQAGNLCDKASNYDLAFLGDSGIRSVAKTSNVRTFSNWYKRLSLLSPEADGLIFFKPSTSSIPTRDMSTKLFGYDVPRLPDCSLSVSQSDCGTAIDLTSLVPCTITDTTIIPSCSKLEMYYLYPEYSASDPTAVSGKFSFPLDILATGEALTTPAMFKDRLDDFVTHPQTRWYFGPPWNQYTAMVHYCHRYFVSPSTPLGLPMFCENDPFGPEERAEFCSVQKPEYVFSGFVLERLSLSDLCPFLDSSVPNSGAYDYCLIFSDHHRFNSVESLLSNRLPDDHTFTGKTLYYVPFTMKVLSHIMVMTAVSNTLVSNQVIDPLRVDETNFRDFGPAGIVLFSKLFSILGNNRTQYDSLDRMCSTTNPIDLETISTIYEIVMASRISDDLFRFIDVLGTKSLQTSSINLRASEVLAEFHETSTKLDFDSVTITTAVPGVPARISIASETTINQVPTCTRFQIDGQNIVLHNLIFDQSECNLLGAVSQTPIVFSGAFASNSRIFNITVIDSSAAVAVLGGNSIVYTFVPLIEANGLMIDDVRFEYTSERNISAIDRYIVAVFAKAIGVPVVSSCGNAVLPPGFSRTANCALRLDDFDLFGPVNNCTLSGKCLTATAPQCCSPIDVPTRQEACGIGYQCGSNPIPNDNRLCNMNACPPSSGVHLVDSQFLQCGSFWQFRTPSTLNPAYMFQEFEFSPSSLFEWYGPTVDTFYDSYNSDPRSNRVRAVGDRNLVLTVDTSTASSAPATLRSALVTAIPFPTDARSDPGHPLHLVAVVPRDRLSLSGDSLRDFLYSPSTQLALVFDRLLSSTHYQGERSISSSVRTEMGTTEWCVGVSNTTALLVIEPCVNSTFRWYVDPVTNRIHPSKDRYSCISVPVASHGMPTASAKAMLLPCRPCAVGFESGPPKPRQGTSLVRAHVASTANVITNVSTLSADSITYAVDVDDTYFMGTTLNGDNFGVLINATDGRCLHLGPDGITLDWHSRCVFGSNTSLVSTLGVFQLPTTGGLGSFLHGIAWEDSSCPCREGPCPRNVTIESTDGTGHGALVTIRSAEDIVVIHHGIGYRSGSEIRINDSNCFGRPLTVRVLIQPQSADDFGIETSNLELVNVTQYTSRFGRGVIATSDPPPPVMSGLLEIGIALVGVLCVAALVLNIILIAYRWKLTENIVEELRERR